MVGVHHQHVAPSYIGGGVALFDCNNDGLLDIFLTGGKQDDALYIQESDRFFFSNKSEELGLSTLLNKVNSVGVAIGDVNNDGWKDIFVTTFIGEPNKLLLNQEGQGFIDISSSAGIDESSFSVSATFGDFNKDGYLDLHVSNYIYRTHFLTGHDGEDSIAHICSDDFWYLNNGDLTFKRVSTNYGFENIGCTLAGMFTDFDLDGDIDLLLANDFGAQVEENKLFVNQFPQERMVEQSENLGADLGIYTMGIASSDYDRDGDLDYYMTNIGKNVLLNQEESYFTNVATSAGVEDEFEGDAFAVGWGCQFIDYDNDGWDDLFVSNGYIPALDYIANPRKNRNNFFINQRNGSFEEAREISGLSDDIVNRGSAMGDLDNDGDLDLVVAGIRSTANDELLSRVYINKTDTENNFTQIELKSSSALANTLGAICKLYTSAGMIIKEYQMDGSHCSVNSEILNFGLGKIDHIDSLIVQWPYTGLHGKYYDVKVNERNIIYDDLLVSFGKEVVLENFEFAPNPVKDMIYLNNIGKNSTHFLIYDNLGRLEMEGALSKPAQIDLSSLIGGIKVIVLTNKKGEIMYRSRCLKE